MFGIVWSLKAQVFEIRLKQPVVKDQFLRLELLTGFPAPHGYT